MNQAIAFDTHRFVNHLTQTGFTERQAEALADEQVRFLNTNLVIRENLAVVQTDLKVAIAKTNERIAQVEANLKVGIIKRIGSRDATNNLVK